MIIEIIEGALTFSVFGNDILSAAIIYWIVTPFFKGSELESKQSIRGTHVATWLGIMLVTIGFNTLVILNAESDIAFSLFFPLFTIAALADGSVQTSYDHFYKTDK